MGSKFSGHSNLHPYSIRFKYNRRCSKNLFHLVIYTHHPMDHGEEVERVHGSLQRRDHRWTRPYHRWTGRPPCFCPLRGQCGIPCTRGISLTPHGCNRPCTWPKGHVEWGPRAGFHDESHMCSHCLYHPENHPTWKRPMEMPLWPYEPGGTPVTKQAYPMPVPVVEQTNRQSCDQTSARATTAAGSNAQRTGNTTDYPKDSPML